MLDVQTNYMRSLIIAPLLLLFLAGCCRLEKVSVSRFAELAKVNGSASGGTYIGSSHNRAYLEYWKISLISKNGSYKVFWAPLADFPKDVQEQLNAGKNPWASPEHGK